VSFLNGGSSVYALNAIKFADGTILESDKFANNAWIRADGNDSITLPSDGATVDAGQGTIV